MARTDLDSMLAVIRERLDVQEVRACMHDDADDCTCRKPKDGMLRDLAQRWQIDLTGSFMVGDTWRDMQAGRSAQCTTILIGKDDMDDADLTAASLSEAVDLILEESE
jgi:D-glycero-D-manno-heptose 1,7-bisphosphate phosphatase